jgi:uncharacterized membrane protein YbhN (UPF0104 family)
MLEGFRSKKMQALIMGLVAVVLLGLFFKGSDFGAIAKALSETDLRLITLAVCVTMVSYLIRALRWKLLLTPIGNPPLGACFVTTVIGFMVNFVAPTGRLGELARPYLLARREGFSASSAFATVFLERVLDLMTVIFLVGSWLLLGSPPDGAKSETAVHGLKVGGATAFLGAGLGLGVLFGFVRYREWSLSWAQAFARWLPNRLETMAMRFLTAFGEGLGVLTDLSNLARAGVLSILLWLNISSALWIGVRAFDIHIPFGATFLVIGFLTVGVAVPTPGAVGGYHVMCSLALTLLFGVDESRAKAAALVNHAIAFLPVALLGMFFFVREGLSFQEVKKLRNSR